LANLPFLFRPKIFPLKTLGKEPKNFSKGKMPFFSPTLNLKKLKGSHPWEIKGKFLAPGNKIWGLYYISLPPPNCFHQKAPKRKPLKLK